ncbi:ectoine dioxygenase-like [Plakobranchus ocellatus]|uniref:Ectoine dioxygenase-like n=1 Tax=Plakobranchus ocellatus TaxID=259542 RepID=A0AAV3Y193_9GAST|nr:ectoine dioxygenase-like [Plakobranchus ocellatus]
MATLTRYVHDGKELEVTEAMKKDYETDGFIIVRNLLCQEELSILEESLQGPGSLTTYAYGNDDGEGKKAKMCLWNHPGDDVTGALARARKLAHTAEEQGQVTSHRGVEDSDVNEDGDNGNYHDGDSDVNEDGDNGNYDDGDSAVNDDGDNGNYDDSDSDFNEDGDNGNYDDGDSDFNDDGDNGNYDGSDSDVIEDGDNGIYDDGDSDFNEDGDNG